MFDFIRFNFCRFQRFRSENVPEHGFLAGSARAKYLILLLLLFIVSSSSSMIVPVHSKMYTTLVSRYRSSPDSISLLRKIHISTSGSSLLPELWNEQDFIKLNPHHITFSACSLTILFPEHSEQYPLFLEPCYYSCSDKCSEGVYNAKKAETNCGCQGRPND